MSIMTFMALDGLTLRALSSELNGALEGCRVQHIYHPLPHAVTLKLWSMRDQTEHMLYIGFDEPPWFHLTEAQLDNPMSPSSFCMLLRKYLKNGFVESVVQDGWERIVDITIRRPEQSYILRSELLGRHGNIALLQQKKSKLRVLGAVIQRPSRPIRPGDIYAPPDPQPKLDPTQDEQTAFLSLDRSDEPLWRWLLNHLHGIGPRLAKELVLRTGLDPKQTASGIDDVQCNALWASTQQMFSQIAQAELQPRIYLKDDAPIDAVPFELQSYEGQASEAAQTLSKAFDAWLQQKLPASQDQSERGRLLKHLNTQIKKAKTALDHVSADQRRAKEFEQIKREADLIMIYLHELNSGSETELADPETNEMVAIKIDPRLSPIEAAQKRYGRYKKLKRGVDKLGQRQQKLQLELDYFQTVHTQVEQAEIPQELDEIAEELGINKPPDPRKKRPEPTGPRRYEVEDYVILVGRNSRQNDDLTRKAQPEDLWLHARERAGSHVVIQSKGDAGSVPDDVRLRAAQLAAYYSKGRDSSKVPVICTRAKFLRKPRGAKPGLVLVSQEEQTILVNPANEENE